MLRLLTLLLTFAFLPAAPAAAEEAPSCQEPMQQEVRQDDGFHGEFARTSVGIELVERERPRENGPRGFGERGAAGRSSADHFPTDLLPGIVPALVHPVPAPAETLPYFATAPPFIS